MNANVITVDSAHPSAQAFAVDSGRVTAVGTNAEILKLQAASNHRPTSTGGPLSRASPMRMCIRERSCLKGSPYYTPWLGPDAVKNMDDLIAILKAKARTATTTPAPIESRCSPICEETIEQESVEKPSILQ